MRSSSKLFALLTAFSMPCVAWALQETDELAAAIAPPSVGGTNQPEVLPPPRRPSEGRVMRRSERLARRQPFLRPAEPGPSDAIDSPLIPPQPPAAEEIIPAPPVTDAVVQPTPPISTDTDRDARRMYHNYGRVDLVMVVKNPADGCLYEIPLCVPACCTGEPAAKEWRGLLGRGVVEYCWDCGFTAKVKFRQILGDVKVEYDG